MSISPSSAICIIDTSVLLMLLSVPNTETLISFDDIIKQRNEKIEQGERFFLPMATILETGNHVQKIKGNNRQCAERYIEFVKMALIGTSPFTVSEFCTPSEVLNWLDKFLDADFFEMSIGDLWIEHEWQMQCEKNSRKRVYVWCLDSDLAHCDNQYGVS